MRDIQRELQHTEAAFFAQCARRDELVEALTDRLKLQDSLEYEKFFFRYFSGMNREEKSIFDQIRAMTEGSLYQGNKTHLAYSFRKPGTPRCAAQIGGFAAAPCILAEQVRAGVHADTGDVPALHRRRGRCAFSGRSRCRVDEVAAANRPEATQKHELTNTSLAVIGANSPSVQ